jgi:hypothetical protein
MVKHDGPVPDDTEEGGRPHATLEEEVSILSHASCHRNDDPYNPCQTRDVLRF